MERVAFLLEQTGERLACLLNPESLIMRRTAGVRTRMAAGGSLSGAGLKDDPVIYTGGGVTELLLDLLFDVSLTGPEAVTADVRTLTRPLFELAEGASGADGFSQPPMVRFVWGKQWNIPGVVTAVAERLEQFTSEGAPQRSWLRMRLVRVSEPERSRAAVTTPLQTLAQEQELSSAFVDVHQVIGNGPAGDDPNSEGLPGDKGASSERLDEIAWRHYGDCRLWRIIGNFNKIENPLEMASGFILRIPQLSALRPATTPERSS